MKHKTGSPKGHRRELRVHTPQHQFEIRKNADGSRSISGYAAVFNQLSEDLGGFRETLQPGAFSQSLKDHPDVLCLYAHDDKQVLGRVSSGTLVIAEDNTGLRFTCQLPDTTTARDLIALLERKDITGCSFGFVAVADDWKQLPDGQVIRTLQQVTLFEISVVPNPAYLSTSVDLRSMPAEIRKRMATDDLEDDDDCDDDEDEDEEDRDDECGCDCEACEDGDCSQCSDPDCDDDDCLDDGCPMQDERRADRLRLSLHFESRRNNLRL